MLVQKVAVSEQTAVLYWDVCEVLGKANCNRVFFGVPIMWYIQYFAESFKENPSWLLGIEFFGHSLDRSR